MQQGYLRTHAVALLVWTPCQFATESILIFMRNVMDYKVKRQRT